MKNRTKVEADSVHVYEGHWADSTFVIDKVLTRSDLTTPGVKPNFIVYLTNGDKVLVGWTDKEKQRLFYIKEFIRPAGTTHFSVKVIRMRDPIWRKTIKAAKKGMVKWFQGQDRSNLLLFDTETISVQPMAKQNFFFTYGPKSSL